MNKGISVTVQEGKETTGGEARTPVSQGTMEGCSAFAAVRQREQQRCDERRPAGLQSPWQNLLLAQIIF